MSFVTIEGQQMSQREYELIVAAILTSWRATNTAPFDAMLKAVQESGDATPVAASAILAETGDQLTFLKLGYRAKGLYRLHADTAAVMRQMVKRIKSLAGEGVDNDEVNRLAFSVWMTEVTTNAALRSDDPLSYPQPDAALEDLLALV